MISIHYPKMVSHIVTHTMGPFKLAFEVPEMQRGKEVSCKVFQQVGSRQTAWVHTPLAQALTG